MAINPTGMKNIKGQPTTRGSGVPLIARVRKGESQEEAAARAKREGKTRFTPKDLDHFRIEIDRDLPVTVGDPNAISTALEQLYGKTPMTISGVQFMADDPNTVFQTAYEKWATTSGGNPLCTQRCDGEHIYYRNDPQNGINRSKTPCTCNWQGTSDPDARKKMCAATGRLNFWLPQLTQLTGVLGELMFVTHGSNDIINILSTLNMVYQTAGRQRGISFTLYRKPVTVTTPDGKPTTKNIVYLTVEQAAAQHFAALAAQDALSLTSGLPSLPPNANGAPLALNAGEAPQDYSLADEVAYFDSVETFDQMCIVEKAGKRMYWFKTLADEQFKTTDTAIVEGTIPLAGMPVNEWFDVELGGRVDGDKVIELWVEVA